jgi:hypothetical protein
MCSLRQERRQWRQPGRARWRLRVDGFEIEVVGREVAVTDMIRQEPGPENLDFEGDFEGDFERAAVGGGRR